MRFVPRHTLALVFAASLASAQEDVPDPSDLRRRGLGDIAVLGDYVYFEGGEISQYIFGDKDTMPSRTESWHNETVNFTEIDRDDKPPVKDNTLWVDRDGKKLYQWDGQGPWNNDAGAKDPKLWSLEPDDDGSGEWSTMQPSNARVYNSLSRIAGGATTVCNGKAYSIGGFGTSLSDEDFVDEKSIPVPGMVTYDFDSEEWNNRSNAEMAPPYGSFIRGKATCVSGIGDNQYVLTIGGMTTEANRTSGGMPVSMQNLTIWDTKNEKWLWQETTGSFPPGRWDHCVAGQASEGGTYEIFVYGGRNRNGDYMDDVWVLTLPGFHWMRVGIDSPERYFHACASLGDRQILVSGGYSEGGWETDDPWINGLGIFDLSALKWSDGYDANANDYAPAKAIEDWYKNGGMDDVDWNSDEVKDMFASKPSFNDNSGSGGSGSSSSNGDNNNNNNGDNNDNNDGDDDSDSSTPVGAIAGGAVGGVAGLALIGAAVFFCRRRRQRQSPPASPSQPIQPGYQQVSEIEAPSQQTTPAPMAQGYYPQHPHPQPMQYQQYYGYKPEGGSMPQYAAELPANQNSVTASELDGAAATSPAPPSELHGESPSRSGP